MANDYDKILRDNFREPKTNLLQQLIPADIISIKPLVPKLQQTIMERETDTIAEIVTDEGDKFIIHIEWQSNNDPLMASRMAMYDLLLHQTYKLDVLGVVLYVGNDKMRMKESVSFFDFHYSCRMLDVRLLDPETFLASNDPGELIFAILAGKGGEAQKLQTIREIFSKLQQLYKNDPATLQIKIKQLELLSLLRGKKIQQLIIREEQTMPVTIDIREDLRYQQGIEEGVKKESSKRAFSIAKKMLQDGVATATVQNWTGLEIGEIEKIAKELFNS